MKMIKGKRILVLGCSGSGKSTFSHQLRNVTGFPLVYLDNLWWRPDRTHISREEFDCELSRILSKPEWIIDGDYSRTYEVRIRACDTVIFLDYDEEVCMRGIADRVGKVRPDIPWTEQILDPELVKQVQDYRENNRPALFALMKQYKDKQWIIFTTRAQASQWLEYQNNRDYIPELEILGKNRFENYTKTRIACRAVIVQEGKILLSRETKEDLWMIPGGGLEEGETPEECCIRETEEETGIVVKPLRRYLTIREYYEEYCYVSHYYECKVVSDGKIHLTEAEIKAGLRPEWLPLTEAREIFSTHQDYAETEEMRRGLYLREYIALNEWINQRYNKPAE